MPNYTLGLDIGSKSIGWAILDKNNKKIINLGVRVFPEGVDRDTKGAEQSKNSARREARGTRRNKWRYQNRRKQLVDYLKDSGLLPKNNDKLSELLTIDPYPLRLKGLDEKLNLYEFGRVLYHLNQRRGFKSNRKSTKANEDGKVIKEASQLQADIESAECRTLGEYMAKLDPEKNRRRDRYTFRNMYEHEFNLLWKKQSGFYPDMLTDELRAKIADYTIFYQRPLKPCDDKIGDCSFEEGKKRCPRDDWYAVRYRILQDVNNLKYESNDGHYISLDQEQREVLINALVQRKEMSFDQIRKLLSLYEWQRFNFEEETGNKKLKGDAFNAGFKSILKTKHWDQINTEKRIELNNAMVEMEDDKLTEYLVSEFGFDDKQIGKARKIDMPTGYMSYSREAIRKLIKYMEKGALQHEAIRYVYGNTSQELRASIKEKLDLPNDTRNPLVNKALFEVRKLINAIIAEYGLPHRIKIEMARDVKGSLSERREIYFRQLENKKYNEQVRLKLINEYNVFNPSYNDITRYKLWQECGTICPYTGKPIAGHQLFSEHPEFQIEHILPYSRSLDDGFYNKTLCWVDENRRKGEKTPYEFYQGTEQYEEIKQRIRILPRAKREKFLLKEISLDENISRELNDTRYITREVIRYLGHLGCVVKGTKGKITAELRYSWGLNNILNLDSSGLKNRDDHRHHAIDAAVVAVTENKHLHKLAETKYANDDNSFPQPWPDFRNELEKAINQIIVSHKPIKRIRGKLHEDTNYGITNRKDDKGQNLFVYRKKLEDLTIAMVTKIVDPIVKQIVIERLRENGFDIQKDKKKNIPSSVWKDKPLFMKCIKGFKIPIKKVRIEAIVNNKKLLNNKYGEPYRAVKTGNNHHIEIFKFLDQKDKQGNILKDSYVVSMFEAYERKRNGLPIINKNHGENTQFICSLCPNEMVKFIDDSNKEQYYRVQIIPHSKQISFRHHTAATLGNKSQLLLKYAHLFDGEKVHIDRLGRVYPAND